MTDPSNARVPVKPKPKENTSLPTSEPEEFAPPPNLDEIAAQYEPPPAPHPESEIPSEVLTSAAKMFTYGVAVLHARVADVTQYQDFRLTEEEKEMWDYMAKELIPHLPLKYAMLIMVGFALTMSEGTKIAGFLRYQQALKAQSREPTP